MKIKVGIVGANGSIGRQALEVIKQDKNLILDFLVINKNYDYIEKNFNKISANNYCVLSSQVSPHFIKKIKAKKKKAYYGQKSNFKIY